MCFSLLLSSFSSHLISFHCLPSCYLFPPPTFSFFFYSLSHVLPYHLFSSHCLLPHFTALSSVQLCLRVTLRVSRLYLWLGVQSDMNPAMAGQRSSHYTPVLEIIIIPENLWTQTHTHRGDILECYCKGVVSYPLYKVIWSYTPEGNTLINSNTCSQTWPSLSPTHTHTHSGQSCKGSAAYIYLLSPNTKHGTYPKTHTHPKKSFQLRD